MFECLGLGGGRGVCLSTCGWVGGGGRGCAFEHLGLGKGREGGGGRRSIIMRGGRGEIRVKHRIGGTVRGTVDSRHDIHGVQCIHCTYR